jgi:hypothetical protein
VTSLERDALRFWDAYGNEEGLFPTLDPDFDY